MYKEQKNIAIIPARGGSKRLPGKNMIDFNGKPLVSWTIEAAINCAYVDEVIVTSDSDEILEVAASYHTTVVKRPPLLSDDASPTFDAINHTLSVTNDTSDQVVLLQATSPLRNHRHVAEAIEYMSAKCADAIVSVCPVDHSPLWANTLPDNLDMSAFIPSDILDQRSQDLPTYYRLNGAIYICRKSNLLEEKTFFLKKNIFAFIMEKNVSIDIDDSVDLALAKVLLTLSSE